MAAIEITAEKASRLKYVNKDGLKPGVYEFPDFLLIGPQRTGTGWLHKNLCFHPQIYMPPEKELFYFNKLITRSGSNYTSDRLDWYLSRFKPDIWSIFRQNASIYKSAGGVPSIGLGLRKLTRPCLKGEATASYAVMKEELIEEIITLNPDIKAVMLVRHPFERAWSHAKKDLLRQRNRSFEEVPFEEFKTFYSKDHQVRCGRYTEIMRKWSFFVQKENFFIGLYDDIKTRPEKLLTSIFSFLGVAEDARYVNRLLSRAVIAKTKKESIPEAHREFLSGLFGEEIELLNKRMNLNWHR